jgi:hypothetical protein
MMCRAGIKRRLTMSFVPQKLSVTAKQTDQKRHIRSAALPCFSKLPNEARPFFRQWHIYAIDVAKINSISYADARQIMQQVRSYYGKRRHDVITIDEFSEYTGKSKSLVRMVVISRTIEHELKRQSNTNGKPQIANPGNQ